MRQLVIGLTIALAATRATATTVWILGDSNSAGLYHAMMNSDRGAAIADPAWNVVDLAAAWTPSVRGMAIVEEALATRPAPDVAIVCYGAVDAMYEIMGKPYDGQPLTVRAAIRNLARIRRMLRRAGAIVVVAQGVGVGPPSGREDAQVRTFMQRLAVAYRDIGRALRRSPPAMSYHVAARRRLWAWDRIHLSDAGYRIVARRVARTIRRFAARRP